MGIKDLFSHRDRSSDDAATQGVPRGDEAGASTTQFDDGQGTVGLGDRLGGGAPDTNQGKAEPMPPTPGSTDPVGTGPHTDAPSVPELGDMSAGHALGQVASPTVLSTHAPVPGLTFDDGGAQVQAPGSVPADDRLPADVRAGSGPGRPAQHTTGTAQRAPGQQGSTPDGESIDSDTTVGAARMEPAGGPDTAPPAHAYPGDSQGVNVPHEQPMPGTSEEQGIVHGIKDPTR